MKFWLVEITGEIGENFLFHGIVYYRAYHGILWRITRTADKTGDKTGGKTGDKTGDNTGDKTGGYTVLASFQGLRYL